MLSFDITDRNIRVVKGVESNGKIKISSAATLNVEEELIVNGHVKDVPNVATLINGILKRNKMPDKEAIVSISSNLTIFKEMNVVKQKNQDIQKVVKQQMQAELNLDDSYSVSYIIVGDADAEEGKEPAYRVLATACPYEIINSYREVFKLLGITLRSVMIGCNCITKVLLADTKIRSKMPLLAVQIDNNFISLNLYEQGQLSFSRFASIDPADYGNSDDYVFEAVNENIFRMLQFHRSRNTGEVIENVIFYGDTHEYVRLTDELEKLDLKTSLINVPPQIHGHENLEFSLYANAIGAMFKRNRDTEKINLLETDLGTAVKNKMKSDSSGNIMLLAAAVIPLVIVGAIWGVMAIKDKSIVNEREEIQARIDSQDTKDKEALHARLLTMKSSVESYNNNVHNAYDAYNTLPVIDGDKYDLVEKVLKDTAKDLKLTHPDMLSPQYSNGTFNFNVTCDGQTKMAQEFPAKFIDNLISQDEFMDASYTGYSFTPDTYESEEEEEAAKNKKKDEENEVEGSVSFSVTLTFSENISAYQAPDAE